MSYCRWGADSDVYVYGTEREVKGKTEDEPDEGLEFV